MSYLECHILNVMCGISYVEYALRWMSFVEYVICHIFNVIWSYVWCHMLNVKSWMSCVECHMLNVIYWMSHVERHIFGGCLFLRWYLFLKVRGARLLKEMVKPENETEADSPDDMWTAIKWFLIDKTPLWIRNSDHCTKMITIYEDEQWWQYEAVAPKWDWNTTRKTSYKPPPPPP